MKERGDHGGNAVERRLFCNRPSRKRQQHRRQQPHSPIRHSISAIEDRQVWLIIQNMLFLSNIAKEH